MFCAANNCLEVSALSSFVRIYQLNSSTKKNFRPLDIFTNLKRNL